ncbi:MAG: hypothetical protein GHCLOJNM_03043 [bacterium]|nr:hypothetical protein [bacterium]
MSVATPTIELTDVCGEHLRAILAEHSISQEELAEVSGVSRSVIRDCLDDRYNLHPANVKKLAAGFLQLNPTAFEQWMAFFLPDGCEVYREEYRRNKTRTFGGATGAIGRLQTTIVESLEDGNLTREERRRIELDRIAANVAVKAATLCGGLAAVRD